MPTIFAPNALVGEQLSIAHNVLIHVDKNIITKIEYKENTNHSDIVLSKNIILLPGFINGHTHVGDSFIKDQGLGNSLSQVVGKNGIKHKNLEQADDELLNKSIENALEILINYGYTSFVDYREGGIEGCDRINRILKKYPIRGIVLGRPYKKNSVIDLPPYADGVGFADIYSISANKDLFRKEINEIKKINRNFLVSFHASETKDVVNFSISNFGKTDIVSALNWLPVDFIIHANYCNKKTDLESLRKKNVGVISCPLTAAYFGLKYPPLKQFLDNGIIFGLGTDNFMISDPNPFFLMRFSILSALYQSEFIPPLEILKALTVNIGIMTKKNIGQIEEGYLADMIGIRTDLPPFEHVKDVYSGIIFRTNIENITFQMYDGKKIK